MRMSGTVMLRNFGRRVNCSFSVINPAAIDLLALDIGLQATDDSMDDSDAAMASGVGFLTEVCDLRFIYN